MRDKTIKVAVAIDVRGKNNRRCGVGCWARFDDVCDLFRDGNGDVTHLSKDKGYLRCKACRDAEVKS